MPSESSVQYQVISVVRARHNRTDRAQLPHNPRRKQYIGANQHRLTHGRPLIVLEAYLLRNLDELREKSAAHILEVRTLDGRMVDLSTLVSTAPPKAAAVTPAFPMDSVENDKNFKGLAIPPSYMNDDLTVPPVLEPGEVPALFADAEDVADNAGLPVPTEAEAAAIAEMPSEPEAELVKEAPAKKGRKQR